MEIHAIRTPGPGTIEASKLVYVPDLPRGVAAEFHLGLPVSVLCGTGFRASMTAYLLTPRLPPGGLERQWGARGARIDVQ